MEDALNGNLGQATTDFLSTIGLIDKKGNPVESTGDNTTIKVETKTKNKNDKKQENQPGFVTPNRKPKATTFLPCDKDGTVLFPQEDSNDVITIDSDSEEDSDNNTIVPNTDRQRGTRSTTTETKDMRKLLDTTYATAAILPQNGSKSFYWRPMTAAYYALHIVGITDEWK